MAILTGFGRRATQLLLDRATQETLGPSMARRTTLHDHTTEERVPAAPAAARGELPLAIVVYTRDGAKAYALAPDAQLVLGRAWPADIVVGEVDLSRHHARFDRVGDEVFVRDLGSTNGTRIGGALITERTRLAPGDVVGMGPVHAIVQVLESPDVALVDVAGHDRFLADLEAEVARMRSFGRRLSLVVYASAARAREPGPHGALLVRAVRDRLRPFDRLGLYAPGVVEVLLPETDAAAARTTALATLATAGGGVLAGIAGFPECGATANELLDAARAALRRATAASPVASATNERDEAESSGPVVASPRMRDLYATVERIARSALPVLVRGETGTGKEEIARALHRLGPRSEKPLRAVNCAALPATLLESTLFGHEKGAFTGADKKTAGVFEQANEGVLFLDEIGELSAASQAALLRALESKHVTRVGGAEEIAVDVRLVAATHRDLEGMCTAGTFRWDLFYRLDSLSVLVPPLRERPEEIEPLAAHFLDRARARGETEVAELEPDALACLRAYAWPGNVRELRNVIERAAVIATGSRIGPADLGERVRASVKHETEAPPDGPSEDGGAGFKDRVRAYETQLILDALERCDWNQTAAARALDMPLRTLVHKIGTYGIRKKYER